MPHGMHVHPQAHSTWSAQARSATGSWTPTTHCSPAGQPSGTMHDGDVLLAAL
jgi:hypothetical protein